MRRFKSLSMARKDKCPSFLLAYYVLTTMVSLTRQVSEATKTAEFLLPGPDYQSSCSACWQLSTDCHKVSGLFVQPHLPIGYHPIVEVPRGACNFTATQRESTLNHLALKLTDGDYFLNGDWAVSSSGEFVHSGTRFAYQRGSKKDSLESVTTFGELSQSITLMLIFREPNRGVQYEYRLPIITIDSEKHEPTHDLLFAEGQRHHSVPADYDDEHYYEEEANEPDTEFRKEIDSMKEMLTHHEENQEIDSDDTLVADAEAPITSTVIYAWGIIGLSPCSQSCAGGEQRTIIGCLKDGIEPVLEELCQHDGRPKERILPCNQRPCPAKWVAGGWTSCNATCGYGVQEQEMSCRQTISPALTITVVAGACQGEPEIIYRTCESPSCAHWEAGNWSQCSATCGSGNKHRNVTCVAEDGTEVERSRCNGFSKPSEFDSCDTGSCALNTWFFTEWSTQCSEACGPGFQFRQMHCSSGANGNPSSCDESIKPAVFKVCNEMNSCDGKWFAGPWSKCSVTCGSGWQSRTVLCFQFIRGQYRIASDHLCSSHTKPEETQACETKNCTNDWYKTEWSACSRSCGGGVQTRKVMCLHDNEHDSASCSAALKPAQEQTCNAQSCSEDENSVEAECTDKFRNCNLVSKARLCQYPYYRVQCCKACSSYLSVTR